MSDDPFPQRVRAAARAAWWTILIGAGFSLLAWAGGLWILSARPEWVRVLWGGGGLTWDDVRETLLTFWSVWKLVLWTSMLAALWLTLWGRRLRATATGR